MTNFMISVASSKINASYPNRNFCWHTNFMRDFHRDVTLGAMPAGQYYKKPTVFCLH